MQTLDLVIRIATPLSVIVGIVTLWVGLSRSKKQMNAQVFIEYTKRFDQVLCGFPSGSWCARTNAASELPKPEAAVTVACLRYLNLCAEELYLRSQGYLTDRVWRIWEAELERTLGSSLFIREWLELRVQFNAYGEFQKYVDSAISRRANEVSATPRM